MQVLVTALTQGGNKGVEEKIQGEIKLKQVCFCLLQSALLFNYYILAPKLGFIYRPNSVSKDHFTPFCTILGELPEAEGQCVGSLMM